MGLVVESGFFTIYAKNKPMKTPLLNREERQAILDDTFIGANLSLKLAFTRLSREIYQTQGYFALRRFRKAFNKSLTKILIGNKFIR